jgi:hypothetical protein
MGNSESKNKVDDKTNELNKAIQLEDESDSKKK